MNEQEPNRGARVEPSWSPGSGPAGLETKKGAVFSRVVIQRDLEKLRLRAQKQGKTVDVEPFSEVDPTKHTVGLTFEITEKPTAVDDIDLGEGDHILDVIGDMGSIWSEQVRVD